jgi:hypothetical protein
VPELGTAQPQLVKPAIVGPIVGLFYGPFVDLFVGTSIDLFVVLFVCTSVCPFTDLFVGPFDGTEGVEVFRISLTI